MPSVSLWNGFPKPPDSTRRIADYPGSSLLPQDIWPGLRASLRLSARELQVVQGIFEDHKEEAIANSLGISPHTVNTYLQRLYVKLRVSSRVQLIVRVMAEYLQVTSGPTFPRD